MNGDPSEPYEPSSEELAEMREATAAEAEAVDALVLAQCEHRWKKVAMLVGQLLDIFDSAYAHLPYCYIQARIEALEGQGLMEVAGNPWAMRHSEVRLRGTHSEA